MIETLIILALILVIIDFFIDSDLLTHAAYLLLCSVIFMEVEAKWVYKLLAAISSWFVIVAFHYFCWKKLIQRFNNKIIAPDKYASGGDGLIGKTGQVRDIDGVLMIKIEDGYYEFSNDEALTDTEQVKVISTEGTLLKVTRS